MANAPQSGETSGAADLASALSGIFLQDGLDRFQVICPSCQLVAFTAWELRLRAEQIGSQSQGWQSEGYARFDDTRPHAAIAAIANEISTL